MKIKAKILTTIINDDLLKEIIVNRFRKTTCNYLRIKRTWYGAFRFYPQDIANSGKNSIVIKRCNSEKEVYQLATDYLKHYGTV